MKSFAHFQKGQTPRQAHVDLGSLKDDELGLPLPAGQLTHHPQGLHRGPPEIAREMARRTHADFDRIEWQIIAIDTRRPLRVAAGLRQAERPSRHAGEGRR